MVTRIFIVVIIKAFAPVLGGLSFKDGDHRATMQIGWSINSCDFAKGTRKIHRRHDVPVPTSRFNDPGPADKKGSAEGFLVHPAFVEPAMLSKIKALVGAVDYDGVLFQPGFLQIGKHASDSIVYRSDASKIVFDIALVFPTHQIFT